MTLDTISDLLLSMDAEMDINVVRFSERSKANEMHPLLAKLASQEIRIERIVPTVRYRKAYTPIEMLGSNETTITLKAEVPA